MNKKLLSVLLVLALALPACAADWPAKSIRMIVPFAAGGGTDLVARALASSAEKILGQPIAIIGVLLFALTTIFTLVTVPVEFDASSRAKKALARMDVVAQGREYNTVSGVLFAAGLTYVAAAISSILQLLYWAYRAGLIGGRRD